MSGIVGYVGQCEAKDVIVDCLKRMEYRGYDSVGMAVLSLERIQVYKSAGKLSTFTRRLREFSISGNVGIGHLRWATHGPATDDNAHPHLSEGGEVAIVHSGVIENYRTLKDKLKSNGVIFASDTDSEVIAHLISQNFTEGRDLFASVAYSTSFLEGAYSLAVISLRHPNTLVGVCHGKQMAIGENQMGIFLLSDPNALLPGGDQKLTYLGPNQLCILKSKSFHVIDRK